MIAHFQIVAVNVIARRNVRRCKTNHLAIPPHRFAPADRQRCDLVRLRHRIAQHDGIAQAVRQFGSRFQVLRGDDERVRIVKPQDL